MSPANALHFLRSRLAGTHRVGEIGALIAIVLALLFFGTVLGRDLNHLSYDLPFIFRPETKITNVVIIYMDEASHLKLNQVQGAPWHRTLHVKLLRKLTEAGAAAVVFDILMDKEWTSYSDLKIKDEQLALAAREHPELDVGPPIPPERVDEKLVEAIRQHGKVIIGARTSPQKAAASDGTVALDHGGYEPPFEGLATNVVAGVINLPLDRGFTPGIRQHYPSASHLTMAAAVAGLMAITNIQPARRYINYYGPPKSLDSKSYYQVLQRDGIPTNYFAGKIVFIGKDKVLTSEGESTDDYPTPYTLQGDGNTPGVEIQATACLNFLRGDWLRELSLLRHLVLFVASGVFFGFLFALVRPWMAVLFALLGVVGAAWAGIQTVWSTGTWFSWVIICVVQVPAALGWAALINTRQLYRENVRLEEALRTATATPPAAPASAAAVPASAGADAPTILVRPGRPALPKGEQWQAQPGDILADHHLVRCVGEGAYGQVWLGRNVIGDYAAVKVVYRVKFSDDAPFEREFQGVKRFMPISRDHAGFVHVLHIGKDQGCFYYVMEAGDDEATQQQINPDTYKPRTLASDLDKRGKLTLPECLDLAIDLSAALEHLHQNHLIHRDIKPSNIIFVKGQPKIADIGLVTKMETTRKDATYIGTPGYIPDEGPGAAAADVYSLGKVIYQAAMGRGLEKCPALPTTIIERDHYKQLLELNDIIIKACAENVNLRYQSAAALHRDLVRLQTRLAKRAS